MRISDWSSDVCSSDLGAVEPRHAVDRERGMGQHDRRELYRADPEMGRTWRAGAARDGRYRRGRQAARAAQDAGVRDLGEAGRAGGRGGRSEEHTSELQSLMRNSYAVFCLTNKKTKTR